MSYTVTKRWRVYGAEGHRQRESFCESVKHDFSEGDDVRLLALYNSDLTGTNDFSVIEITRNTAEECVSEFNGQLSDGVFENSIIGRYEEIDVVEFLGVLLDGEIKFFRESYDEMTKAQAYNDWYIIGFFEEYYELLSCDFLDNRGVEDVLGWLATKESPLSFLYNAWMDSDGAFSHDWEDMLNWICSTYEEEKAKSVTELIQNASSRAKDIGSDMTNNGIELEKE